MLRKSVLALVTALALAGFTVSAWAQLSAVGPTSPGTGNYPVWYQDLTPRKLELCLSKATGPNGPLCVLLPLAGVFDPAKPVVFPFNFPDESFYFVADATINSGGVSLVYRAALEAAFANGDVVDGDQIVFARIRIRVDVPTAGTYTITHPYGIDTFTVTAPGVKAINSTVDIGVGAPGIFTGALDGRIGPFLTAAGGLITAATGEQFIGDPNITQAVTGGPFGNIVRIQGPGGIDLQTNQFFLAGKIFGGVLPTDVSVTRATYGRQVTSSQIDVFATSAVGALVTFRETLALSTERPTNPDGAGNFYGQSPNAPPPFVVVTATAGTAPPTALSRRVVDVVKITKAEYVPSTLTLIIEANSSDQVSPPTLTALEFGTLAVIANPVQRLIRTPVVKPPATVTVKSSAGGDDTEPVAVVPAATVTPVASADTASTVQGTPVNVNVLANDTGFPILKITTGSVSTPANGTAVLVPVAPPGSDYITYTPTTAGFFGTDTFTYTMTDGNSLTSNAAIVTVKVNGLPVAANDTANTSGGAVVINVLANDTDPDGNLPLAVVNLTQPPAGQGSAVNNGTTVTYTPPPVFTGSTTFTYQAADTLGALSNIATVTVTAGNQPPKANPDSATALQATPVDINVVTNDTDPDGTIVAASITIVPGSVVGGTAQANVPAAGFVRFIPNTALVGTGSFSYTVRDNAGAVSNVALVTVTVNRETLTGTATATRRGTTQADWNVSGTTNVPVITTAPNTTNANVITVFANVNADGTGGTKLGTATPDRQGRWKLSVVKSPITPAATNSKVGVTSTLNNSIVVDVTVK